MFAPEWSIENSWATAGINRRLEAASILIGWSCHGRINGNGCRPYPQQILNNRLNTLAEDEVAENRNSKSVEYRHRTFRIEFKCREQSRIATSLRKRRATSHVLK
jgi:hypothetical protein